MKRTQCFIIKINLSWCSFLFSISDENIDKETFLSLADSGSINFLTPKIGPRVKFRKRLKEYLKVMCSAYTNTLTFENTLVFLLFFKFTGAWTFILVLDEVFLQINVQKIMQYRDDRINAHVLSFQTTPQMKYF